MRVLMLLDAPFPPDPRVEKEAETLMAAGHEVHIVCYSFNRTQPAEELVRGIHVHRMYFPGFLARKVLGLIFHLPIYVWWWKRRIEEAVRVLRPDVVHAHDLPLGRPALQALGRKRGGKPVLVLDLHENYPDLQREGTNATQFPQKLLFSFDRWFQLEKELVCSVDSLIVINEANRDRLREVHRTGVPVAIVRNTVKVSADEEAHPDEQVRSYFRKDRTNLLYIGGLDRTRGLETVLHGLAAAGIEKERFHLVLAGSGSYRSDLESLADRLGLSGSIVFPGFIAPARFGDYCVSTDICLLPLKRTLNTEQADPNKIYQYAFWGKPILASGTQTVRFLIGDMQCGLTYEPDDPESFARSLIKLASEPQLWDTYGRNGRRKVLDTYNWDSTARTLVALYQKLEKR